MALPAITSNQPSRRVRWLDTNNSSPWSDSADQGELGASGYSAAELTASMWMDQ